MSKNKEYFKKYYQDNKERLDKINREYVLNNKDKIREYQKEYMRKRRAELRKDISYKLIEKELSKKRYSKELDGYHYVYLLEDYNYVGVTNCLFFRFNNHKHQFNRDCTNHTILLKTKNRDEALELESKYHDMGYAGKHKQNSYR